MAPLTMQQMMDFQKQQNLAQALMGNQANPQTPYAGVANAGNNMLGAYLGKQNRDNMAFAAQGIAPVTVTPNQMTGQGGGVGGWFKNLFSMGGS